ncbi:uncharacterized protein LOC143933845 isoform X1 [Lithobates pipiens]
MEVEGAKWATAAAQTASGPLGNCFSARINKKPPPTAPMYDTVANDIPVYSVVDKSRSNHPKVEENVQYAEIEVIRPPTKRSQKKPAILPKPVESTEYATINFHTHNDPATKFKTPPGHNPTTYVNTAAELKSPHKYNSANGTLV